MDSVVGVAKVKTIYYSISGGRSGRALSPARAVLICGAMALLGGCGSEPESHVVSAPPPPAPGTVPTATIVTTQTTPGVQPAVTTQAQSTNTVVVTQAPPAAQAEVVLAQPGPDYRWIPGYWTWRNERYEWMAGHWEIPPQRDSVWVAPRWESESGGYRFYEGYWN
jgi:hypothetical protein